MASVAVVAATAWFVNAPAYNAGVRDIQQLQEDPPPCFGAAAVLDASCADADFGDTILPAPGFAGIDRPADAQCFVQLTDARPVSCTFGSDDPDAPRVALVGDSHAYQLLSTFQRIAEEPAPDPAEPRLTERETEVLKMVAKGLSYRQIAERLVLSHRTVQNHVQNTLTKLQMHNRVELTRYAIEHGLDGD